MQISCWGRCSKILTTAWKFGLIFLLLDCPTEKINTQVGKGWLLHARKAECLSDLMVAFGLALDVPLALNSNGVLCPAKSLGQESSSSWLSASLYSVREGPSSFCAASIWVLFTAMLNCRQKTVCSPLRSSLTHCWAELHPEAFDLGALPAPHLCL